MQMQVKFEVNSFPNTLTELLFHAQQKTAFFAKINKTRKVNAGCRIWQAVGLMLLFAERDESAGTLTRVRWLG